jgi:hypothetical protein
VTARQRTDAVHASVDSRTPARQRWDEHAICDHGTNVLFEGGRLLKTASTLVYNVFVFISFLFIRLRPCTVAVLSTLLVRGLMIKTGAGVYYG